MTDPSDQPGRPDGLVPPTAPPIPPSAISPAVTDSPVRQRLGSRVNRLLLVPLVLPALAGVVIAVIWRCWAPKTLAYALPGQVGSIVVIPDESESQVAADGRFLLLTVIAGVLIALLTWVLRSTRGPLALLSLTIGSLIGATVAWQIGSALATGHRTGAPNSTIRLPLTLHATALVFVEAFVAALVYVLLAGLAGDEHLGRAAAGPPTGTGHAAAD